MTANDDHIHAGHEHVHGPGCGHASVEREGHVDYVHEGHAHAPHGAHYDEHPLPHLAHAGHEHVHGPGCGHPAISTAITSTTCMMGTAMLPTVTTMTSTRPGSGCLARPAPARGASCQAEEMTDDLHGVAERRLRRIDQRYTSGRRAIVELLVSAGHPVSIGDIAERLPGLPRSSAYRHLTDLQAPGSSGGSPPATNSPGTSSPRT